MIKEGKERFLVLKALSYYLKPWELILGIGLFAFLSGWSIYKIPALDDKGVYAAEDVIVSWYCSGGGKAEFKKIKK